MAHPPAIDFEFFQPGHPHDYDHAVQLAALRKEADRRRRSHAIKVDRGDMRSEKAEVDEALWAELIADVADRAAGLDAPRRPAFTWAQKLNGLRGEIIRRRRTFPRLVEKGSMPADDATRAIAVLECAHRWYWLEGMAFGAEFAVPGNVPATYARFREEEARRAAWLRDGGLVCRPGDVEIVVDRHRVRHLGPGPFRVGFARLPDDPAKWVPFTVVNAAGVDAMFGLDTRIRPILDALDPQARTLTLPDMADAFTTRAIVGPLIVALLILNLAAARRAIPELHKEAA